MAQNKKIKYTTMTAKKLAEMISEKLKTNDSIVIENILVPSKIKHGEGFISMWENYPTNYIENKEFYDRESNDPDTTLKCKYINFKNCKLRDAELVIRSYNQHNSIDVFYDNCEVQHFNFRITVGMRDLRFNNCKVQNCLFCNCVPYGSSRTDVRAYESTSFEYCVFEHCKGRNIIHREGETFINCKFRDCDFVGAELDRSTFTNCLADTCTRGFQLVCPEKGEYIAFKKAVVQVYKNGKNATSDAIKHKYKGLTTRVPVIVELRIPKDAKRSSATTRKCRASKAEVLSITTIDGKKHYKKAVAGYHCTCSFVYEVGKTVVPDSFEENRWIECAPGIHHFISREEAVAYEF